MTSAPLPSLASPHDFDLIEAAVKETERGRWFLDEYARRNRHAETERVLDALSRLEGAVLRPDGLSTRLLEELGAVGKVLSELCSNGALTLTHSAALATGDGSALATLGEHLHTLGHGLRPQGVKARDCDLIDRGASELFAAAARLDHAARREALVYDILKAVEGNIGAVLARFGQTTATAEPDTPAEFAEQMEAEEPASAPLPPALSAAETPPQAEPPLPEPVTSAAPLPAALPRPRLAPPAESPFAGIDHLPPTERLRLFH